MTDTVTLPRSVVEQPQVNSPEIPEGWRLVPEEPTEDMLNAVAWPGCAATDWEHMLAAAPQPPVVEQPQTVTDCHQLQPQVEQEPVAWMDTETRVMYDHDTSEVDQHLGFKPTVPLYTHPQNLRCKSTQARLATLWGYVKEQPQQEQEWKRRLGNLLAVIHGDGGHYIEAHGWDKAQADAEERVARVMTGLPQSASMVWPRTASEVRAFLSGHVAAERYARDDHQPDDSDTYTLSAHDLLGAIDWWTDCAQPPRQPLTDQQISKLWSDAHNDTTDRMAFQVLARLVETAHGIGGEV